MVAKVTSVSGTTAIFYVVYSKQCFTSAPQRFTFECLKNVLFLCFYHIAATWERKK